MANAIPLIVAVLAAAVFTFIAVRADQNRRGP
jgi:hypothetical protein